MVLLQISPPDVPTWVRLVSQVFDLASGLVGLAVAYIAYRGYRRNDSRAMFFIALGFALAIGVPFVLVVPVALVPSLSPPVSTAIVFLADAASLGGLLCILYALRLPA